MLKSGLITLKIYCVVKDKKEGKFECESLTINKDIIPTKITLI